MCGFVCVINRGAPHPSSSAVIPPDLLRHRGPDRTAEYIYGNVAIRNWRLSIVDLSSHSDQPIIDQDGAFVYNGELYDYKVLGARFGISEKGDTRTFLSLLSKPKGIEAIRQAPGFFAFLHYSKVSNQLVGGRDSFGKKPLFFYVGSDIAIFSSEERGILPFIPRTEINAKALGEYLLYKSRFFGTAYFKGMRELAPGASFSFNIDKWEMLETESWDEYYRRSLQDRFSLGGPSLADTTSGRDAASAFRTEFEAAVKRRLQCDVPVQIALSGGADSAAVAAVACRSQWAGNVLSAVTVQFQEGLDESERARRTAELLGLSHRSVIFDSSAFVRLLRRAVGAMAGPLDHPHSLAYLRMCEDVRQYGKVLLTGEGADELFFGYRHYDRFDGESFAFREYLRPEDESAFSGRSGHAAFTQIRKRAGVEELRLKATASPRASRELEIKSHLISLLQRNDRMSMENSVEIRAPFLDPGLLSLALSGTQEIELAQRKQFVRDIVCDYLPELPAFGPKNGFRVPFDENFSRIAASQEGKAWIDKARGVLADEVGVLLHRDIEISPRLGWSLLNIGCFMDMYFA